jgi:hypothetical protein
VQTHFAAFEKYSKFCSEKKAQLLMKALYRDKIKVSYLQTIKFLTSACSFWEMRRSLREAL